MILPFGPRLFEINTGVEKGFSLLLIRRDLQVIFGKDSVLHGISSVRILFNLEGGRWNSG